MAVVSPLSSGADRTGAFLEPDVSWACQNSCISFPFFFFFFSLKFLSKELLMSEAAGSEVEL